ncbi:hypothetical protein [Chthonobacter albigriseus]|uniref:hypothetical protein n=1 Tax=Chthonobacter albigriseus TaxID=1683161 RepID=UPI0015EF7836|nr:hypothetical protein [Chthonobacter albigriseus]
MKISPVVGGAFAAALLLAGAGPALSQNNAGGASAIGSNAGAPGATGADCPYQTGSGNRPLVENRAQVMTDDVDCRAGANAPGAAANSGANSGVVGTDGQQTGVRSGTMGDTGSTGLVTTGAGSSGLGSQGVGSQGVGSEGAGSEGAGSTGAGAGGAGAGGAGAGGSGSGG